MDDILNIQEACELLKISDKTFQSLLRYENIPGRKIGREWKFSRIALVDWVGKGKSKDYFSGEAEA